MLVERKSRFFQQYDFKLWASRNQGEALPFLAAGERLDALSLLRAAIGKEVGTVVLASKDECKLTHVSLSDDGNYAALLFRRSSSEASTPMFGHRKTGALRKPDREDEEDLAVSAHLFIDMRVDPLRKGVYRAILEEVPSLGKSYVQSVMLKIIRATEYGYKDRNKADKTTFTACRLDGYKSETLSDALKKGAVPFVELVRASVFDGLDTESFRPKEQKQKIYMRKGGLPIMEKIRNLKDWATGQGWDEVRIQIRTDDGRARLVPIAREEDAAAVLFVKAELITVEKDLDICCDRIEPQLFDRALTMFVKKWGEHPET